MDQNRKTLRHFQCRDYLWEIFTQMSQELECSVDYLVNESMRQYARSRNYGTKPGSLSPQTVSTASAQGPASKQTAIPAIGSSTGAQRAPAPPPVHPPPAPPPRASHASSPPTPPPPAPPPRASTHNYSLPPTAPPVAPAGPPPMPGALRGESMPPPLPAPPRTNTGLGAPPTLFVVFNGQKIPVNKPEFVIGRGSKTADLPIRDGNISRRHAAIVRKGDEYWIKDLGSTNGLEFAGQRVDQKRIEEGDLILICDYELRFTYR